jgi:hypothetical protein
MSRLIRLARKHATPALMWVGACLASSCALAHPHLCQVIADRYRPLANSHPGEAPLNVLAASPTSGLQLASTAAAANLRSADLGAWAAAQKPPFSISPALLEAVHQYQEEGGTAKLTKATGIPFFSFSGIQGSMGCSFSQSFVVRGGVALPSDTPGEPGEEGACNTGAVYGTIDATPVAMIQKYDWHPGMTASIDLWNWNGEAFDYECTVHLTYKPHFSEKTLNTWGETCEGGDCGELRRASFKLAEAAEADPQQLRDRSLGRVSAKQKKQFDAMEQLFDADRREPSSNDAFSIPVVFHDHLYLASIGHYAIGWRDYADWSLLFAELEDGKLIRRGEFSIGTWKGDLVKVSVTEN